MEAESACRPCVDACEAGAQDANEARDGLVLAGCEQAVDADQDGRARVGDEWAAVADGAQAGDEWAVDADQDDTPGAEMVVDDVRVDGGQEVSTHPSVWGLATLPVEEEMALNLEVLSWDEKPARQEHAPVLEEFRVLPEHCQPAAFPALPEYCPPLVVPHLSLGPDKKGQV